MIIRFDINTEFYRFDMLASEKEVKTATVLEQEVQTENLGSDNSDENENVSLIRVADLADLLADKLDGAIDEIDKINRETHMLSINARIEASRADEAGKAFTVVAEEMNNLSGKTSNLTRKMRQVTKHSVDEIGRIIRKQAVHLHGVRLSDLALNNIDLIDRNLYERSCDVRWWATDGSLVKALSEKTNESKNYASQRLGVILSSYTVYYDLVWVNLDGDVIANGKPDQYRSQGTNVSEMKWFKAVNASKSGDEYGFQTVTRSPLVNDSLALVYSCGVRKDGKPNGELIGALGVIFNWEALAQTIINNTPLPEEEKPISRICIIDSDGKVFADSQEKILDDVIHFDNRSQLFNKDKDYLLVKYQGEDSVIAHAKSQGYETYKTGWHSVIIQKINKK